MLLDITPMHNNFHQPYKEIIKLHIEWISTQKRSFNMKHRRIKNKRNVIDISDLNFHTEMPMGDETKIFQADVYVLHLYTKEILQNELRDAAVDILTDSQAGFESNLAHIKVTSLCIGSQAIRKLREMGWLIS
ncbi:hypothetical protein Trydic_g8167 [Trypoxylus dichotomus]